MVLDQRPFKRCHQLTQSRHRPFSLYIRCIADAPWRVLCRATDNEAARFLLSRISCSVNLYFLWLSPEHFAVRMPRLLSVLLASLVLWKHAEAVECSGECEQLQCAYFSQFFCSCENVDTLCSTHEYCRRGRCSPLGQTGCSKRKRKHLCGPTICIGSDCSVTSIDIDGDGNQVYYRNAALRPQHGVLLAWILLSTFILAIL